VKHVTRWRAIATAGAASLLAVGLGAVAATAAAANPDPARGDIAGTHPAWATTRALTSNAPAPAATLTASVYLAPQPGLAAFAQAVSSPGSSLYGHYLTTAQVAARFAPTSGEISAVEQWLTSDGLSVTGVVPGIGGYVQVTGTIATAARAFGVTFGTYKVDGTAYRAPEEIASAPGDVAPYVLSVIGLDNARHDMRPAETLPPPGQNYFAAPDCSKYYGEYAATQVPGTKTAIPKAYGIAQPWTNCGYTPAQIRGVYGVTQSGETGKGVTVAVVDAYASPTMRSDANQYAVATGDKPFAPGQYTQVLLGGTNGWDQTAPNECDASGWYGEESLDVESVHGMAPGAHVTYVGAVDCTDAGLLAALAYIVNHHTADIVTDSWGEPYDFSTLNSAYDAAFQAGAAEGIGFFFSAGDNGYEDPNYQDPGYSDKVQVDYPTSSPWVTSVGGTSLAISTRDNYEFETPWGTTLDPLVTSKKGSAWGFTPPGTPSQEKYGLSGYPTSSGYDGSGGGGVSTAYPQPWYQASVVPASLATTEVVTTPPAGTSGQYAESYTTASAPMRVVPDVSALADPSTGILVGETLYGPGKLSGKKQFYLSRIGGTSVSSPIFAGIEADAGQAAGHPLGFANPVIYSLASSGAFHDVTSHPRVPGLGTNYTRLGEVRSNYTDPYNKTLPLVTALRTLGIDGVGHSALTAAPRYDDATGVGSPGLYIEAIKSHRN
jgi:subtilase family serine protease